MRRVSRVFLVLVLCVGLMALPGSVGTALATPEDDAVTGLKAGLTDLSDWLGSLNAEQDFGQALPLLKGSFGEGLNEIGEELTEGLHLDTAFASALAGQLGPLGTSGVQDLADDLEGLATAYPVEAGDNRTVDFTAGNSIDPDGPIWGFDLTAVVTRKLDAARLKIAAPEATLQSVGGAGVPIQLTFTAEFKVRYSTTDGYFFIVEGNGGTPDVLGNISSEYDDTPRFTAAAQSLSSVGGSPGPFTLPTSNFKTAIGVGDLNVQSGSVFNLNAQYFGDINDTNLDNELAFQEPGNPGELIDAELMLPPSQNVDISRSGSASTTVNLDSPFTAADDDAQVKVDPPTDLAAANPAPATAGADIPELAQFENVKAVDLLSGLVQYATLLHAIQTHPNADFELPFLKGNLSDVVFVHKRLADFIDARVQDPPEGFTPADPDDLVDFDTVNELADLIDGITGFQGGPLVPSYNVTEDLLTFDISIAKSLNASFENFPAPDDADLQGDAGLPNIGGQLLDFTGLAGVAETGPTPDTQHASQAEQKSAYEFSLPFIVNLENSVAATDDPETAIVEFENPMVPDRFMTNTSTEDPEMTITGLVQTPIDSKGQIGFVGVNVTNSADNAYSLAQKVDTNPTVSIDVDATHGTWDHDGDGESATPTPEVALPALLPIGLLLVNLTDDDDPPDTANDPVEPATPNAKVDMSFDVRAPGPQGESYFISPTGNIDVTWPDINTALAASNVVLDANAQMLEDLDIDRPNPGALLGKVLDVVQNVTDAVSEIPGSDPLFDTDIPFVGASLTDLFQGATDLKAQLDQLRTEQIPVTLQDMEVALQEAFSPDLPASALNFSLGHVVGDNTTPPELTFRFNLNKNYNQNKPLNIALDFGNIAGIGSSGNVQVSADTLLKLNVPITLEVPSASDLTGDPKILNSSGFQVGASATDLAGNTQIETGLGPLRLRLGDSADQLGRFAIGARFKAWPSADGEMISEGSEQPIPLSQFLGDITPEVESTSPTGFDCSIADDDPDNPPVPPSGADVQGAFGCAALPVYVNNQPFNGGDERDQTNYLKVSFDSLSPLDFDAVPPDGLTIDDLLALIPDFSSMKNGLQKLRAIINLALKASTFGAELPLIGDKLAAGAQLLSKIDAFLANPLAFALPPEADIPNTRVDWVDENVRQKLYEAICGMPSGTLTGCNTGVLRESSYAGLGDNAADDDDTPSATISRTDIRMVMICDGEPGGTGLCDYDDPATTDADDAEGDPVGDENEADLLTNLQEVRFEFELGQGARDPGQGNCDGGDAFTPCPGAATIPLDFGLPGLNIEGNGDLSAQAGWNLQLGFGVNRTDGFFVLDNPRPSTDPATHDNDESDPTDEEELRVGFGVGITAVDVPDDPLDIAATLGFLDVGLEDTAGSDAHASALKAEFDSDLTAPSANSSCFTGLEATTCSGNKITVDQIPGLNPAQVLNPSFSAEADVDLQLTSGIAIPGSDTDHVGQKLPKLRADLLLNWSWGAPAASDSGDPECGTPPDPGSTPVGLGSIGAPAICLNNFGVDPGTLFSNTFGPMFEGIQKFVEPVEPIREFIFAPIPVISDVSRLFGGDDITYVDLAEIFGDIDLSLLEDINDLLDFIDTLASLSTTGGYIPIGDGAVNLDGARAKGPTPTPDQAASILQDASEMDVDSIWDAASSSVDDAHEGDFEDIVGGEDGNKGGGDDDIRVPILDEPGCLLQMLFGGDCDLFEWTPDTMELRFDFEIPFGPFFGVLYVTIGGFAGARADISVGYDTRGIRQLFDAIKEGDLDFKDGTDVLGAIGKALNGVYLGDLDEDTGEDIAELEVFAGVTAGAKLSVFIAEFGARGGVEATVGLNLHDGPEINGKLHFDEIMNKIAVPFCLFDVEGRLEAFLEVYMTVGVCPFCAEYDFELARVILLDFSEGFCPEQPPNLASSDGNVVTLNVGDTPNIRGPGWDSAVIGADEAYVVRELTAPGASPKRFSISAFGYTEEETGNSILIPNSGSGDDSFVFQGLKTGGEGQETPAATPDAQVEFTAPVVAQDLGTGNDSIITGSASDQINGGDNDDSINSGSGNDGVDDNNTSNDVTGGPGADSITGGEGNDVLRGGSGNDSIDGGLGNDDLFGEANNDRLDGGRDVIVIPGTSTPCPPTPCDRLDGPDDLVGGDGNDQLDGGNGNDNLYGDEILSDDSDGANTGGQDLITGGLGQDTVFGGFAKDVVNGGAEETFATDTSPDFIHGNAGPDELHGGQGADDIWGGSGNDKMFGGPDNDELFGQDDDDDGFGAGGTDDIFGNNGDDELFGEANDDNIFGGNDEDELFGGPAADDINGNADNDMLFGDANNDDLRGGTGSDDLFGGRDEDFMMGDLGLIDDTDPEARVGTPFESFGDDDRLFGELNVDTMWGEGGDDELQGGPDNDLMFGNDHEDLMLGQTGFDRMIGGSADETAADEGDEMYGGTENDKLIGDNGTINSPPDLGVTGLTGTFGDDLMNGGPAYDLMHGQEGNDTMYGLGEDDHIWGDLGNDWLYGGFGHDYMLGDEGTISPEPSAATPRYPSSTTVPVPGAPIHTVSLDDLTDESDNTDQDGGVDNIFGESGDDHIYGGAANDIVRGGFDDDYIEGNNGQDKLYGNTELSNTNPDLESNPVGDALFDGEDDIIGGSSPANPNWDDAAGAADEGELEVFGNAFQDVIAGDNARIISEANVAGTLWLMDNITLGRRRTVKLIDQEKTGAALDFVSGNDTLLGNSANDRIYGEAGNDCVKGNANEDFLEGNQDSDWVEGNGAQDDIVGGTSFKVDTNDDLVLANTQPDADDYLYGGGAPDVALGDNAVITRDPAVPGGPYNYTTDRIISEIPTPRHIKLLDLTESVAVGQDVAFAGPDQISGGEGSDVLFGQDESDYISGGSESDYMEGNGDAEFMWGDLLFTEVAAAGQAPPGGIPPVPASLALCASNEPLLNGVQGQPGQDDMVGGSSENSNFRDASDHMFGNAEADFQLGDNGKILRKYTDATKTAYLTYLDANVTTLQRDVERYDVGGPATDVSHGNDFQFGNDGDDVQYGQDGNDTQEGGNQNDDMYGELGNDRMFGQNGEDAMLGDRGVITNDLIVQSTQSASCTPLSSPSCDPASFDIATNGPPFIKYRAFRPGMLDRRFEQKVSDGDGDMDGDGNPVEFPGISFGGNDFMRGGPDHDSMHGAFADDFINGDDDGDIVYGDDGADALWGGRGHPDGGPARGEAPCTTVNEFACPDEYLDYIFGGRGGDPNVPPNGVVTNGADVIDYRPRTDGDPDTVGNQPDPAEWFEITDTGVGDPDPHQFHQGIDWMYGGWDRDVMQTNVSANGPNDGDRAIDWDGAYNLYVHCNPAYGGYNDIRALSPTMIQFLEKFAFATGVGTSVADVQNSASSAYREIAIVYQKDLKFNSGKAYPTTPGHFEFFSCEA